MSYLSIPTFVTKTKKFVENSLGFRFFIRDRIPHGVDIATDIKKFGYDIKLIIDVGANIGQSAVQFREYFHNAKIYCFEPVKSTYEKLIINVNDPNVICYQMAVGSNREKAKIYLKNDSSTNTMIERDSNLGYEIVSVTTLDHFTNEKRITSIDLLKIDTEGFDFEVLKGAKILLSEERISFIIIEVGFDPNDDRHVLFDKIRDYLADYGYFIFGIYHQRTEWSGEMKLRFADVMFFNINK